MLFKKHTHYNTTVIFSIVVYGCDIWCFILREKYRLSVLESRVLRVVLSDVFWA